MPATKFSLVADLFSKYRALIGRVYARKMGKEQILEASGGGKFWVGPSVVLAPNAKVGAWTYIQSYSYIGHGVVIGRYCSIARGVEISPVNHDYSLISNHEFLMHRNRFANEPKYASSHPQARRYKHKNPAIIGDDVWLGAKACVLRGVQVQTGAVVGANAVVTRNVPPYAIVAGVPARIIGYRFQSETIEAMLASRWWLLDPADLDNFDLADPSQAAKKIAHKLKSEGRI